MEELECMYKLHQITNYLYLTCLETASDKELLKQHGITYIISVMESDEVKTEIPYIFYPLIECDPKVDIIPIAEKAHLKICELKDTEKILIHCHAGINRSPAIVLFHLLKLRNSHFESQLEDLKKIRPIININTHFMKQIKSYF